MKQIKLTQGTFALVDDEDFERANQHKWYVRKDPRTWYAMRNKARQGRGVRRFTISMHRFLMDFPESSIDHKDGNGLNNQRLNIRLATRTQNQGNRKLNINNTSGYKGVCWLSQAQKWEVYIRYCNKQISLGLFKNKIDAAKVYDKKARELHGEFARVNFS